MRSPGSTRWHSTQTLSARPRPSAGLPGDEHLAGELAGWIEADPDWELLAPVPFATVCLRCRPRDRRPDDPDLDAGNEKLMAQVNRSGSVFLSHARLAGKYTIRVALGNPRAGIEHVRGCWEQLKKAARDVELVSGTGYET